MNGEWREDALGWEYVTEAPYAIEPRTSNALGIDTSDNQTGTLNWAQVAASRQFVYVKASEGSSASYATVDEQYQGAMAAGLSVGLYHFADPSESPEANADAFASNVNRLGAIPGHLPPCLDLETGTGDMSGWAQRFITRLRANTGAVRVMVYAPASFFRTNIGESWMDSNIALWIASWGTVPGQPSYMSPRVAIHQYANNGQVAGISGNVDLSYAIWPLTSLIPNTGGSVTTPNTSVLTPAEEAMLIACYQQFSGSATVGQWPGWPSYAGGTGGSRTLVDWARNADVQNVAIINVLAAMKAELDSLKAATPAAGGTLSDADVQRIAAAVVQQLAGKLAA